MTDRFNRPSPGFWTIWNGDQCIGSLIVRSRQGVEGYDADSKSVGIFEDLNEAARAVRAAATKEEVK